MNKYLKDIFIHLDGIAMCPIYELIIKESLLEESFYYFNMEKKEKVNNAYFSILIKILLAQKIIRKDSVDENLYNLTSRGENLIKNNTFSGIQAYYKESISLLNDSKYNKVKFNESFSYLYKKLKNSSLPLESILNKHLEGALIAPIVIYLYRKKQNNVSIIDLIKNKFDIEIISFLKNINFIDMNALTEKGNYILSRSYAYGVTASYLRTFTHLEDLIFANSNIIWRKDDFNNEYHVNRALNVWGSGKSHKNYFNKIDAYIKNIFNQPLDTQPKGIADMGCGDGSFLYHLYDLVENNTLRGKELRDYPLSLIGADYNQTALNETLETFRNNPCKPMTILADISDPDKYADDIKKQYSIDIKDFLNVRSFLDHNRTINLKKTENEYRFKSLTTNAFAWKGLKINSFNIQNDLVNHFKKWKKYINKFGLLTVELHFININNVYDSIGKIPITAYMATHGFSDQFIIEYDIYKECLIKAGLKINTDYEATFPNKNLKMISINLIN